MPAWTSTRRINCQLLGPYCGSNHPVLSFQRPPIGLGTSGTTAALPPSLSHSAPQRVKNIPAKPTVNALYIQQSPPFPSVSIYILCPAPWNGENTPRTLGFALVTGFVTLRSLSPDEFRSSSAFASTWLCSRLRTQMTFSRPLTAHRRKHMSALRREGGVR